MSRSTQFIGLTADARDWVQKNALKVIAGETPISHGMFDEPLYGDVYCMPVPEGPNKAFFAREVVQCEPWSSGPMVFTCLELSLEKENGQIIPMGRAFEWALNPSLEEEFDEVKGHYNF